MDGTSCSMIIIIVINNIIVDFVHSSCNPSQARAYAFLSCSWELLRVWGCRPDGSEYNVKFCEEFGIRVAM